MSKADMKLFVLYGFLLLGFGMAIVQDMMVLGYGPGMVMAQELPKKCRYSRMYSMFRVACRNMDLETIPPLKTDIQVLDASKNRIRELTNMSLAPYKNLVYLFLGDNFLQTIEDAAFDNLRYLEILDLTKNGFDYLPKSLFELAYLQKVYLASNKLTDATFKGEISSPLNFLQLSKNRLTRVPELGLLPSMAQLNVSENNIAVITAEDLAPYCRLKVFDFSNNPVKFNETACECQTLKNWLETREIVFRPNFNCTQVARCARFSFGNRTLELYDRCSDILRVRAETEKARSTWILIASCSAAVIGCIFMALYCVHRRNKKRRRRLKEQQRLAVNNAKKELLSSSNLKPENT